MYSGFVNFFHRNVAQFRSLFLSLYGFSFIKKNEVGNLFRLFFFLGFHCGEKEFRCDNGECVKNDLTCDGDLACKDESDEENCGCPSSEFSCQDGKCIPAAAVCDGSNDCSDGDDEHNCRKFMIALRTPREFSFNSCGHLGLKSDFFFPIRFNKTVVKSGQR